jgi:small subunit ribosomal protein S1
LVREFRKEIVDVLIISPENKDGHLVLSRRNARLLKSWERIKHAHANDEIITGRVRTRTKGGLVVEVEGIETFLPGSQIDIKPIRDYDQYVGKTMEFKVVKVNEVLRNAVVSHKVLIENDLEAQKMEIISRLEKGQVLEGVVKNMTDFGVFIDLGGVDGLLHITDMSWGRINHPSDMVSLDETIQVVVLDFDDDKKRISLGMKQLQPHPWNSLPEDVVAGSIVKGKIVTVADYGSFLEIMPGIEGLIHVSEMSWSQHLRNPQDFHQVNDEVEAVVLSIDREDRKMSLGIKQLSADPWINIADRFPVNSKHKGIVRNLTNFGLFVELGEGVDGLVHVSDLSWTKKINHPSEFTKKGAELEVVVLEIDTDNRRLSLGHKQLEENPWDTYESIFYEGSTHDGKVLSVEDKGAIVALSHGIEAFCPKKHLRQEDGNTLENGATVTFKVIEFNKDSRKIMVSHSRTWEETKADSHSDSSEAKNELKKKKKVTTVADSGPSTMGELDALSALKAQFDEEEKAAPKKATKKKADAEDSEEA